MRRPRKHSQLQIRVSEEQKIAIRQAAERAGMDMSAYVLRRTLPVSAFEFQRSIVELARSAAPAFVFADINALLCRLTAGELRDAVASAVDAELSPFAANYVAAMIETACERRRIPVPAWTARVAPLEEPVFGTTLQSLRLYLLTHSPAAFRRRNIFIDASLGDQV